MLEQQKRIAEERAAAERVAELVRQRAAAAAEMKRIAEEREREEAAELALQQQNRDAEAQLLAACNARMEAERLLLESTEARIAAEQRASELARQKDFAELSALQATNTKIELHEQAIAALNESEEVERSLSEEVREELHNTKTQLETGKLLQRLKKTHRINRASQAALVVSLMMCVGLWISGAGANTKPAEKAANNNSVVVAQFVPAAQANEPASLESLKLSAKLGEQASTESKQEREF
jgi:hypothetical protein